MAAWQRDLRLVTSGRPSKNDEPWYLVTNNLDASQEQIIDMYYHRFEIEEFFRDAKRLLGLEYINFKTEHTLSSVLWFVILTTWFLWEVEELLTQQDHQARNAMDLSIVRYCLEQLNKQILRAAELQFAIFYGPFLAYEKV